MHKFFSKRLGRQSKLLRAWIGPEALRVEIAILEQYWGRFC
jgi:hypothetical protein